MKNSLSAIIAALTLIATTNPLRGSVIEADASSAVQTNFDGNILANDLITNGSAAVSGVTTTGSVASYGGDVAPPNSFTHLTDGAASSCCGSGNDLHADTYFDTTALGTNPSVTYAFNSPSGVTLTSINSIYGWGNNPPFSHQNYQVSLSFVGSPNTFQTLTTVNYDSGISGGGPNSSQVTLTDTSGTLASGVAAIRFAFLGSGTGQQQVIREIDVTGVTAPEPSSIILFALGALGLLRIARRRE